MDSDLCETSAVELRRLIGARQISPLELLETCIAPIEQVKDVDLATLRVGTTEDFGLCIVDPEIRRGKFFKEVAKGTSVALIDPTPAKAFPTSEAVHQALRGLLALADEATRITGRAKRSASGPLFSLGFGRWASSKE